MIPAPPPVTLPIAGVAERFPVHRVFCVGRNYAAHAVEMGHDPDREPPFFFEKAPACIGQPGEPFTYPSRTADVHHEIELVVALAEGGADLAVDGALDHVFGYGVGLDMTRRDLQAEAKSMGRPWDVGKSFDGAAPMAAIAPVEVTGHPASGRIHLSVNGDARQDGDLAQMIWKTPEIIAELSSLVTLRAGDLIMTGTPAGVGPVVRGDHLAGAVAGVGMLDVTVV